MGRMKVPAVMENLDSAIDFVVVEAEGVGFEKNNINKIRLACEEIMVNIIHYAYPEKTGTITISCHEHPEKKGLFLEFRDTGIPFDPLSNAPPDSTHLSVNQRMVGGLGIQLVMKVMDELDYRYEEKENILTLVKYLENRE